MIKSGWKVAATVASAALLLAASAHAVVVITGGEATGAPGATVSVGVSLTADPEIVAGTENVIGYDTTDLTIAARANGRPDCAVNPDIEKGGTAFAFQPSGCTGTACTAVKALVLALDNVDPIPNGVVMYTCQVVIAANATAGEKLLSILDAGASDPAGTAIPATGEDGRVIVGGGAADANIIVGSDSGEAGATIQIPVSLDTSTLVAGTENVIEYASPLSILARSNGRPDCAVNPDIEKGGTAFAFQPSGCTGAACTAVKALVLALDNVDPILTGVVMYTCMVGIATDAVDGEYPLTCTSPGASDPAGGALNAECTSGIVTVGGVVGPTATPTATPVIDTPTPGATSTVTATSTRTIKPTNTPGGGGGGNDDDGCAVVAPAQSSNAWMLLLPAVALLWVRRRTR